MPRRRSTRHIVSDAEPPGAEERRREIERILKLSPRDLTPEKCAQRQRVHDRHILQMLEQSLRAAGFDTLDRPGVVRKKVGEPPREGEGNE
jgi:hypothetical protein